MNRRTPLKFFKSIIDAHVFMGEENNEDNNRTAYPGIPKVPSARECGRSPMSGSAVRLSCSLLTVSGFAILWLLQPDP